MAHFEFSSVMNVPKNEVFGFISDMANLSEIMAEDYKIEATSPITKMKKGSEYEIRITRAGISVSWGIIIEDIVQNEFVRDRQSHGPFALWVHTQKVEDHGQGTLMTDFIEYDVPFGLLGKLADDIFVRRDLAQIFARRHARIADHFAKPVR